VTGADQQRSKLSVVVPATDDPPTLARCLSAIRDAVDGPEEIIVADEPRNGSPAAARNLGAKRAAHDIIVFVDADVVVARDAFVRIRRALSSPSLAAVFGSYDDAPDHPAPVSAFRNLLHHHVHHEAAGGAVTFWAGLGAIRKEAFFAVGGFDERRFPRASVEDIDLGMRLAAAGAAIRLDPSIQGKHLKRWTLAEMVRTDLFRRGIPWMRLLLSSDDGRTVLNVGWRHRVSALASVALVAALLTRRPRQAAVPLVVLLTLNRDFYALVLRKRGAAAAGAAVPLHVIHHLTSVAAVPLALASHLFHRKKPGV
jgi:cellulose synthase/poly-beta-1,6-N-acetylglucosamine synthase-like glycosyltransferase